MVAQRRFGPLIVVVFLALFVLVARLFQVQILERRVWSAEADGLVRSAKSLPGERGRILDRDGNVLVRDEPAYQIDLRYRDFRRGHPLGILAHARSTIERRAVTIAEAYAHRVEWTSDLLHTSQEELDHLARGLAWKCGETAMPAAQDKERELCARRAVDVRYYVAQLCDLESKEADDLRKRVGAARALSFLEVIGATHGLAPDVLLERVQSGVEVACRELALLGDILPPGPESEHGTLAPFDRLLAAIESVRSDLEDDAADELFRNAAEFEVGEVSTHTLQSTFDLGWIQNTLCWDTARLETWIASRRSERDARIEFGLLPRMLVQVELLKDELAPERLLDELARLWRTDPERDGEGRPLSWRKTGDLVVLSEIDTLFAGVRLPHSVEVPDLVLPFQDEELRATEVDPKLPWHVVGMLSDLAGKDESGEVEPLREPAATAFWTEHAKSQSGFESREARQELGRLVRALDRRHAAAADRLFASLVAAHAADAPGNTRLRFSEDRLRRAETQEKYVFIDRGNRPVRLFSEPSYDLVQRVARHPENFSGFEVCQTTHRVHPVVDARGKPCAGLLIGDVRKPQLREMLKQTGDEKRLAELQYRSLGSEEDERELENLRKRVQNADEWTGGSGLEHYLDPELSPTSGWLVSEGLEERGRARSGTRGMSPSDGEDVVLTLDQKMQIAAQNLLAAPRVPNVEGTDETWFRNPVGAILLLTLDGDVLVAASAPDELGLEPAEGRDDERKFRRERTLQKPTFQPPGSVFKPFVAAYALSKFGFDPLTTFECEDPNDPLHGRFETMHCLEEHHTLALHRALVESCNAYFAQLGLRYDTDQALDMMHTFGFGEATGILCLGTKGRSGLIENMCAHWKRLESDLAERRKHLQFSNGLSVIEATPMQVGRAMAGIVTGSLPTVRLVQKIGEREIPHESRSLGLDEQSLATVRAALNDVVLGGTAKVIGRAKPGLGFTFACKTGSADYRQFETPQEGASGKGTKKLLKHTWIAGYFPADKPRAVLVVFLHETAETSTKTAVFLAQEFLELPEVKAFATRDVAAADPAREEAPR